MPGLQPHRFVKQDALKDVGAHLTVEGHTVAAVVMAIEGLCAETAASIPDGDCLVGGGSAKAAAEGLPAHLIHRVHMPPAPQHTRNLHLTCHAVLTWPFEHSDLQVCTTTGAMHTNLRFQEVFRTELMAMHELGFRHKMLKGCHLRLLARHVFA